MLSSLHAIVGEKGVISDPAEMAPWLTDWRGRWKGDAVAVVSPASTEEVAAVVRLCSERGEPVFPVGGNTGLCFGAVPLSGMQGKRGIVLSLRRMNRIRQIDEAANLVTVDAGVVLGDLHEAAAKIGRQFPLQLGSEGSAQIGGLISTNAGGTAVVRYGPMRDLVAGLEVVLADGRVLVDLAALKKDNTGYMLRHLFIGAEGTLGVITGAVLRLHPPTPNTAHAWVSVPDPAAAVALLTRASAAGGILYTGLRTGLGFAIRAGAAACRTRPHSVRRDTGLVGPHRARKRGWIERARRDFGRGRQLRAGVERSSSMQSSLTSQKQADEIWHVRHSVSEANKKEGIGIVHDVAVRTSDAPSFIAAADKVAAEHYPQAVTQVVCHLGDGNVHYILMFPHDYWKRLPDPDGFALGVEQAVHDAAATFSGTFSAEHGVGRKLTAELKRLADPLRYELMGRVKTTLDPQNLMNPGVLLADSSA